MKPIDDLLADIARKHLDSLAFHDVALWGVKDALLAAYQAGQRAASLPLTFAEARDGTHTPGPWHIEPLQEDEGKSIAICKAGKGIIAVIQIPTDGEVTDFTREEDEANALRIVAAVNACEGISTEVLKPGLMVELFDALADLLGDMPDVQNGQCIRCGRDYRDYADIADGECPSDDCPSYTPRALLRRRSGRPS
jgi:hypothetical protein